MREMKNSGIEWIGEIPSDWSKNKTIRLFSVIGSGTTPKSDDENNFSGDINWIQSGDINGGFLSFCKNQISDEVLSKYSALKVYKAPFIVIAMYGASIGNLSISNIDACVNQACCVLSETENDFNYLFYAIKTAKDYLIRKAVGGGQPNISQDTIKQLWLPQPSLEQQKKIADFLDEKCAEIDTVIEKTKATIEEYKKLKQSVITQAVTKGIRPNRPMKDSGIEWIGEIPADWDVKRGKAILTLLEKPVRETDSVITCFRDGQVTLRSNRREDGFTFSLQEVGYQGIDVGDLVVHGMDGFAGAIGISDSRGKGTPVLNVMDSTENKRYIMYYLRNMAYNGVFIALATGIRVRSCDTNWNKLKNLPYIIPSHSEQQEIVDYIDRRCSEIDELIAKKTSLLSELENYKKSLIYEYVTGKKEVK